MLHVFGNCRGHNYRRMRDQQSMSHRYFRRHRCHHCGYRRCLDRLTTKRQLSRPLCNPRPDALRGRSMLGGYSLAIRPRPA